MSLLDILLLGVIAVCIFFACRHVKRHGCGCGGSCASCGQKNCCGQQKKKNG